jgi:putative endonuclease
MSSVVKITSKYIILVKAVELAHHSRKDIGNLGEKVAAEYLRRRGMRIVGRNIARKTGEIDIIARQRETLHFVEVKSILCVQFPDDAAQEDAYDPTANLHEAKIRRVARTSEWYVANTQWEGEWQLDAVLVWLRKRDGMARVRYLPQIL